MYYFLNAFIPRYCSGIEHAEFKRLANFLLHGVDAKIVTSVYTREASDNLAVNHLDYKHYVNLYDFFCDNTDVPEKHLADEDIAPGLRLDAQDTTTHCYNTEREVMSITHKGERIDYADIYDGDHQLVRRDYYDTRGFKGFSQFFATDDDVSRNYVALENFYSSTGRVGVEITYRKRGDGIVATAYRLRRADGREWYLMSPDEMYTVFLDELNAGGDTFISDRSDVTNRPMINMTTPARKLEHFHNIHFQDFHDPMHSPLTYPSIGETELLSRTDMVITPTEQQASDMRKRLKTTVPIHGIPVGAVPDAQLAKSPVLEPDRIKGKIIMVARLYWEKHVDDAIWAFKAAHDKLNWLTLDIYGYGDGNTDYRDEKLAKQIVKEQGLEDVVHFMGYSDNIAEVYDKAQVMLLSSRHEGFVLAILEAASHGVPTISYDTNYGPAELIKAGKSGEIVPYGDVDGLASMLVKTFSSKTRLANLSKGAYARAKDFSQEAVWNRWKELVIDPQQD